MLDNLSYTSVKFIKVHNPKLALLHYVLLVGIFVYIVTSIVLDRGYQSFENVVGTTSIKIKGIGTTNGTLANPGWRILDAIDVVIPPVEMNAFFVMTQFVRTPGQRLGVCPGLDSTERCTLDVNCTSGRITEHGITNGTCANNSMCFVNAWCPVEDDGAANRNYIDGVQNFTVFAKVSVEFPFPNRRFATSNAEKALVPGVNLFTVNELVERATCSGVPCKFSQVRDRGAILLVGVDYSCNIDPKNPDCSPKFTVSRIDTGDFSTGFNYRYTALSSDGQERVLTKATGIRVLFHLYGQGGLTNFVALLLSIGSGVGLLGVATVVCDFVLQYLMPNKERYRETKYDEVTAEAHVQGRTTKTIRPNKPTPHSQNNKHSDVGDGYSAMHG